MKLKTEFTIIIVFWLFLLYLILFVRKGEAQERDLYRNSRGQYAGSRTSNGAYSYYRDSRGRIAATASTQQGRTTYRDAQGRLLGTQSGSPKPLPILKGSKLWRP